MRLSRFVVAVFRTGGEPKKVTVHAATDDSAAAAALRLLGMFDLKTYPSENPFVFYLLSRTGFHRGYIRTRRTRPSPGR